MSIMRYGEEPEWEEEAQNMYVYFRSVNGESWLDVPDTMTPEDFIEITMRSLAQSGELSEEELRNCHQALRSRFNWAYKDE